MRPLLRHYSFVRATVAPALVLAAAAGCGDYSPTAPAKLYADSASASPASGAIAASPAIVKAVLESTTMLIDAGGAGLVGYDIFLTNPTTVSISDAIIQGFVRQGATWRAAGGALSRCPGVPLGVLPPGNCAIHDFAQAANASAGVGQLVPGPAVLELTLIHRRVGLPDRILDKESIAVTLVAQ